MRFRLYKQFGALNSRPVFAAFEQGLKNLGHESVQDHEDVAVIWSVLWQGRMIGNQQIYRKAKELNIPIIIIEIGNLRRGTTWRISVDNINGHGYFGNDQDLDTTRPQKIGAALKDIQLNRTEGILIACQHPNSLQWEGMPSMQDWVKSTISEIRKHSSRPIVVRPHPRAVFDVNVNSVRLEKPKKIPSTYDDFDIDYRYHCVINHNSGPAVQAAINGIPVICHSSSLAYPVTGNFENIESISLPDRKDWFLKLCHTEWTVEEISQGIPVSRILSHLENLKNS